MGKAKEDKQQPAHVAELMKNGTAVLTSNTRDELAEMVNDIPADVAYRAGAVGHNHETGEYTLRIDIAKL